MKRKGASKDTSMFPFHGIVAVALTAGNYSQSLSPQGLTNAGLSRVVVEADNWAHFRVRSFRFRVHHGAITGDLAVGYVGGVQDTAPATKGTLMELLSSVYHGSTYTEPSKWVKCSASELAGPLPWYKSIPGTADSTEEAPGVFVASGTGTDTIVVELEGVLEFKTSVAPANTPAQLKLLEQLRLERQRVANDAARTRVIGLLSPTAGKSP